MLNTTNGSTVDDVNLAPLSVYFCRPFGGLTPEEIKERSAPILRILENCGLEIYDPMSTEEIESLEPNSLLASKSLSIMRDGSGRNPQSMFWKDYVDVNQADMLVADLREAKKISIGCVSEIAWAYHADKIVIILMNEDDCHNHFFMDGMADEIFTTNEELQNYLMSR